MATTKALISVDDYLIQEAKATHKSEYYAGDVVMMAGAAPSHNQIVANLIAELVFCLKAKGCIVYASDLPVIVPACDSYFYPDITIVCENPNLEKHQSSGLSVLYNPQAVVEVISPSTELRDRTEKFECYKKVSELKQYVLIDSQKVQVETFDRVAEGWLLKSDNQLDKSMKIAECDVLLKDIYNLVEFESESEQN